MDAVEHIRNALDKDPSKPGLHPAYRAIVDEITEGGHAVRERYYTEPELFPKLVEALRLSTKCGTPSSDDVTSLNEVEMTGDVKESNVDPKIHDDTEIGLKNALDCGVEDMELDVAGAYRDNVMEPKSHSDLSDTSILDDDTACQSLKTEREFKFSNQDKLLNDPELKELMEKINDNPAFIQMMQLMSCLFHDSTADQFNAQAYFSAAKQFISNIQYVADADHVTNAVVQNDSKRGEEMIHIKDALFYNTIVDEIKAGGLAVLIRYFTEPELFGKLVEAFKLSTKCGTASSGDVTSLNKEEKPGDVKESNVDQKIHDDSTITWENAAGGYAGHIILLQDEWLKTANLEDPIIKSWIECGKTVGAHESPLHLAAFYARKRSVEYLLEMGADPLLENFQGWLPIELASLGKTRENSDVVELLDKHMKSQIGV